MLCASGFEFEKKVAPRSLEQQNAQRALQSGSSQSNSLIFLALTTLSFLITTPEAWVPALGDANHGFPYLSGVGRLVIKDWNMLGAAFLTMTDAAREALRRRNR